MRRLTTPTHRFIFNTDPSDYVRILITYKQGSKILLEKEKDELAIEEYIKDGETYYAVCYELTQEDSKKFSAFNYNGDVHVQVRVLAESGEAYASEIFTLKVSDVLNDTVLTDEVLP